MNDLILVFKKSSVFQMMMAMLLLGITLFFLPGNLDAVVVFTIALMFAVLILMGAVIINLKLTKIKLNHKVIVERLRGGIMPSLATVGSNGYDCLLNLHLFNKERVGDNWKYCRGFVISDVEGVLQLILKPEGKVIIPLGFKLGLPTNLKCKLLPKSGIGLKSDILIPNSPGLIDTDYKGEVCVILVNSGSRTLQLSDHKSICQLTFEVCPIITLEEGIVDNVGERGIGGHGSTGESAVSESVQGAIGNA